MKKLMCKLFGHSMQFSDRFEPSINARIVTDYHSVAACRHCGYIEHSHLKWTGSDFVELIKK